MSHRQISGKSSLKIQHETRITRKLKTNTPTNIDAKNFSQLFANRFHHHIERIIHHNQVEFIPRIKD